MYVIFDKANKLPFNPNNMNTFNDTVVVDTFSCSANILFDEGTQQSFISQALADQLNICTQGMVTTAISSFGGTSMLSTLPSANIELITKSGEGITLSVLIILKIATH